MRRFPRALGVPVFAVFLSGCALPLPAQVASMIADGISWFSTDKTISDHAISIAANEDCSVWRVFSGDHICRDNTDNAKNGTISTTENRVGDGGKEVNANTVASAEKAKIAEDGAPLVPVSSEEPPQMMPIAVTPPEPAATVEKPGGLHFVLASFEVADNARRLVDSNPMLSPTIVKVQVLGRTMHRVVVGPFTGNERKALGKLVRKAGFGDAWVVRMDTYNRPPRRNHRPSHQLARVFR